MKTEIDYEVLNQLTEEEATTLMYYVFAVTKAQNDLKAYKAKILSDYLGKEIFGDLSKLFDLPLKDMENSIFEDMKEQMKKEEKK